MATRTVVQLVSDLSGDELEAGEGQTVEFSYRGIDYTIDLTEKEAAGFDKSIAMYIEHATRVGGRKRSGGTPARRDPSQTQAIKAWADTQGLDYPKRGRLPQSLLDAYEAAH